MNKRTAAIAAAIILFGYAIFELLLALGLPLGHYAWGGSHEVLPTGFRIASIFAIFIYAGAAAIILSRAGVGGIIKNEKITRYGTWFLTIYFSIGLLMNTVSRSPSERWNVPFILCLVVTSFIVAKSKSK